MFADWSVPVKPNFKILDDDLYLGSDVWLRWTEDSTGTRTGALVIHKIKPDTYCLGSVSLKNDPDGETRDTWDFNGNWESPTLTPSVLCHCKFHGFITEGKWISA